MVHMTRIPGVCAWSVPQLAHEIHRHQRTRFFGAGSARGIDGAQFAVPGTAGLDWFQDDTLSAATALIQVQNIVFRDFFLKTLEVDFAFALLAI